MLEVIFFWLGINIIVSFDKGIAFFLRKLNDFHMILIEQVLVNCCFCPRISFTDSVTICLYWSHLTLIRLISNQQAPLPRVCSVQLLPLNGRSKSTWFIFALGDQRHQACDTAAFVRFYLPIDSSRRRYGVATSIGGSGTASKFKWR